MLGAIYATFAALTFAMNNAAMRRGVLTGTAVQAMVVTIPIGGIAFLMMSLLTGQLTNIPTFPRAAVLWLAGQGVLQFMIGRFFNYQANKLVGVNISAPIIQLQVVVTLLLAVIVLREKFTLLQALGTVIMLAGSFATQWRPKPRLSTDVPLPPPQSDRPKFKPQYLPGTLCGLAAATAYGIAPLMVRAAFESSPIKDVFAGGVIAYAAATAVLCLIFLVFAPMRKSAVQIHKNSAIWFSGAALLVAASHGFVYASLAIAPLMVVIPILQLSLIFRIFLSEVLNRDYEVMNAAVVIGSIVTIVSSIVVSIDTDYLLSILNVGHPLSQLLRIRIDEFSI